MTATFKLPNKLKKDFAGYNDLHHQAIIALDMINTLYNHSLLLLS